MQRIGLCVFSLPISGMMSTRKCVLYFIIIMKLEVWPICHCLRLGNETMVCTVSLSIFFYIHKATTYHHFLFCDFLFCQNRYFYWLIDNFYMITYNCSYFFSANNVEITNAGNCYWLATILCSLGYQYTGLLNFWCTPQSILVVLHWWVFFVFQHNVWNCFYRMCGIAKDGKHHTS